MPRKNYPSDIWKKINMHDGDVSVCWNWAKAVNPKDGRPYFTIEGKKRPAQAIVMEEYTGEKSSNRPVHSGCSNILCCNPHHLSWGKVRGEKNNSGLPVVVVKAIEVLLKEGRQSNEEIGRRYGISELAVLAIEQADKKRA